MMYGLKQAVPTSAENLCHMRQQAVLPRCAVNIRPGRPSALLPGSTTECSIRIRQPHRMCWVCLDSIPRLWRRKRPRSRRPALLLREGFSAADHAAAAGSVCD